MDIPDLHKGLSFSSYELLEEFIRNWEKEHSVILKKIDARSINGGHSRSLKKCLLIKPSLKYLAVAYGCANYGVHKSRGTGERQRVSIKSGCKFSFRFVCSDDGQELVLSTLNDEHNHETSEVTHTINNGRADRLKVYKSIRNRLSLKINNSIKNSLTTEETIKNSLTTEEREEIKMLLSLNAETRFIQDMIQEKTGKPVLLKDINYIKTLLDQELASSSNQNQTETTMAEMEFINETGESQENRVEESEEETTTININHYNNEINNDQAESNDNAATNLSESGSHNPGLRIGNLLEEGTEFDSFDAFQATFDQYCDSTFAQFSRLDSKYIDRANNPQEYNKEIIYKHLSYACIYGEKRIASKSTGLRITSSKKTGCPVRLRLCATADKQRLVIKESKLDGHNHVLSEENYRFKGFEWETELEIFNLIDLSENKRMARQLVQERLTRETGKTLTAKDIHNIEARVKLKQSKLQDSTKTNFLLNSLGDVDNMQGDIGGSTASADTLTVRPKRRTREPKRFRETETSNNDVSITVSAPDSEDFSRAVVSLNRIKTEPTSTEPTPASLPSKVVGAVTVKEGRGKKRKAQVDLESPSAREDSASEECSAQLETFSTPDGRDSARRWEIRERKLAIQEELLKLEKIKFNMLQDIMKKLDHVIENQSKK